MESQDFYVNKNSTLENPQVKCCFFLLLLLLIHPFIIKMDYLYLLYEP